MSLTPKQPSTMRQYIKTSSDEEMDELTRELEGLDADGDIELESEGLNARQGVDRKPQGNSRDLGTKLMAFSALVVVQFGHVVFFRASQHGGKYDYNTASAIATSELFKALLSAVLYLREGGTLTDALQLCISPSVAPVWIALAFLYAANNQLTFWLLLFVGPGQLTLGKSMAPMVSAVLLWGFYNEPLNSGQWVSLVITVCGLVSVLDPSRLHAPPNMSASANRWGLVLLTISCLKTGVTSVVNSKMLQKEGHSINALNVVLYGWGFVFGFIFYNANVSPGSTTDKGYFHGYGDPMVMAVILCQSFIGIVISYVLKYGGAIVKTLASAVLASVLSITDVFFFGVSFSFVAAAGSAIVIASTYNYFFVALRLREYEQPLKSSIPFALRVGLIFIAVIAILFVMVGQSGAESAASSLPAAVAAKVGPVHYAGLEDSDMEGVPRHL